MAHPTRFFISRRSPMNRPNPDRVFPITAEEIARINPNSGTAPIFRSPGVTWQIDVGRSIARLPVLGRIDPLAAWSVAAMAECAMSTNARHGER